MTCLRSQLVSWSQDLNLGMLGSKQSSLFPGASKVLATRTGGEEWGYEILEADS